jgi:hypothetical protein
MVYSPSDSNFRPLELGALPERLTNSLKPLRAWATVTVRVVRVTPVLAARIIFVPAAKGRKACAQYCILQTRWWARLDSLDGKRERERDI